MVEQKMEHFHMIAALYYVRTSKRDTKKVGHDQETERQEVGLRRKTLRLES